VAFQRCWCGHYHDQHEPLPREGRVFGRCLAKGGHTAPPCTCREFKPLVGGVEGTDIYRDDDKVERDPACVDEPGYHLTRIEKGELGKLSKVREELDELLDAERQGAVVMQLCEAADVIGAIGAWLEENHPTITLGDLIKMSELNARAFRSGRRK
jgi:hypothetical protein